MLNRLGLGTLGLVLCGLATAAEWNLQPAASKMGADLPWLHEAIMVLVIVLLVGSFGVMFWSCYAHRRSVGHKAVQFHKNVMVEILWTVIPAIILALVAWPVAKVVIAQNEVVLNGMPKTAMQPFKQSNNVELAAAVKGQSTPR
ncbi:MAG: hypothetical protein O2979_04975 [Proteobacteria bacterium]|nr:hypothetical protein [Pseudomonadota bacterium]